MNDVSCDTDSLFHPLRMSAETMPSRDNSMVGRFHSVAVGNGQGPTSRASLSKERPQRGGCRRWLQWVCPCCYRNQSGSLDLTDEPAPEPVKEVDKPYKPHAEARELEGDWLAFSLL